MDADLNLNQSSGLPDGTTKANRPRPSAGVDVSADDLKRGYLAVASEPIAFYDRDDTGENQVGNPFTFGGFCGRPRGNAR